MDPKRRPPSGQFEFSVPPSQPSSGTRLKAAARASSGSGQYPVRYGLVRDILLCYLSPILVDSVLEKSLAARNLTPAILSPRALAEVTSDIMVGLRLFVPSHQLPMLMLELAEVLESDAS